MSLRDSMQPYIKALTDAIDGENWHLALMPALTLPDICSTLDGRGQGRTAYIDWFNLYSIGTDFNPTFYTMKNVKTKSEFDELVKNHSLDTIDPYKVELLSGVNAYSLRCAFLHNGNANISEQRAHKDHKKANPKLTSVINTIKFISDSDRIYEQIGDVAEINAKRFCEQILVCVEKWIAARQNSPDVIERAKKMIRFIG